MKFQIAPTVTLLAAVSVNALALGNIERDIELVTDSKITITGEVMNSAAFKAFQNSRVLLKTSDTAKRQVVTPDNIFVLQCVDAGFREPCLVFGAAPGDCGK